MVGVLNPEADEESGVGDSLGSKDKSGCVLERIDEKTPLVSVLAT